MDWITLLPWGLVALAVLLALESRFDQGRVSQAFSLFLFVSAGFLLWANGKDLIPKNPLEFFGENVRTIITALKPDEKPAAPPADAPPPQDLAATPPPPPDVPDMTATELALRHPVKPGSPASGLPRFTSVYPRQVFLPDYESAAQRHPDLALVFDHLEVGEWAQARAISEALLQHIAQAKNEQDVAVEAYVLHLHGIAQLERGNPQAASEALRKAAQRFLHAKAPSSAFRRLYSDATAAALAAGATSASLTDEQFDAARREKPGGLQELALLQRLKSMDLLLRGDRLGSNQKWAEALRSAKQLKAQDETAAKRLLALLGEAQGPLEKSVVPVATIKPKAVPKRKLATSLYLGADDEMTLQSDLNDRDRLDIQKLVSLFATGDFEKTALAAEREGSLRAKRADVSAKTSEALALYIQGAARLELQQLEHAHSCFVAAYNMLQRHGGAELLQIRARFAAELAVSRLGRAAIPLTDATFNHLQNYGNAARDERILLRAYMAERFIALGKTDEAKLELNKAHSELQDLWLDNDKGFEELSHILQQLASKLPKPIVAKDVPDAGP